jgi:lanosterol synthase
LWNRLRNVALDMTIDHVRQEDSNTKHIDIGPVNKCINMLAIYHAEGNQSANFLKHKERIFDYLWLSEGDFLFCFDFVSSF